MPNPPIVIGQAGKVLKNQRVDVWVKGTTGNDANDGMTAGTAVKTAERAAEICSGECAEEVEFVVINLRETITITGERPFEWTCRRPKNGANTETRIIFDGGPDVTEVMASTVSDINGTNAADGAYIGLSTLFEAPLVALVNDIKAQYEAHRVLIAGAVHGAADATNVVSAADATDIASAITLVNDLRTQYEAHRVLTAGAVHGAADATNAISAPAATDAATAIYLANDLLTQYEAHRILIAGGVHGAADNTNVITEAVMYPDNAYRGYWLVMEDGPSSGKRYLVRKSTATTLYLLEVGPAAIVDPGAGTSFHLERPATEITAALFSFATLGANASGPHGVWMQNLYFSGGAQMDYAGEGGADAYGVFARIIHDCSIQFTPGIIRCADANVLIHQESWDTSPALPTQVIPLTDSDRLGVSQVNNSIAGFALVNVPFSIVFASVIPEMWGTYGGQLIINNSSIEVLSLIEQTSSGHSSSQSPGGHTAGFGDTPGVPTRFGGYRFQGLPGTPVYPAVFQQRSGGSYNKSIMDDSLFGIELSAGSYALTREVTGAANSVGGVNCHGHSTIEQMKLFGEGDSTLSGNGGTVEISDDGVTQVGTWAGADIATPDCVKADKQTYLGPPWAG